jgi:hypothetical protein
VTDEKRWPEVTIFASGVVADRSGFRKLGAVSPPDERYVPVSSANVLSEEEAWELVRCFDPRPQAPQLEPLWERLSDFAEGSDRG